MKAVMRSCSIANRSLLVQCILPYTLRRGWTPPGCFGLLKVLAESRCSADDAASKRHSDFDPRDQSKVVMLLLVQLDTQFPLEGDKAKLHSVRFMGLWTIFSNISKLLVTNPSRRHAKPFSTLNDISTAEHKRSYPIECQRLSRGAPGPSILRYYVFFYGYDFESDKSRLKMISPISISFSEEMNASDVLDSWLEALGQYEMSEASSGEMLSKISSTDRPSRPLTTASSSPTLPTTTCAPSPLTKSERSNTPSIDIDDELRLDRQSYCAMSNWSDGCFARNSQHDSMQPAVVPDAPLLCSDPVCSTTDQPLSKCVDSPTVVSRSSTSTLAQYLPDEPVSPPPRSALRARTEAREVEDGLPKQHGPPVLVSQIADVRPAAKKDSVECVEPVAVRDDEISVLKNNSSEHGRPVEDHRRPSRDNDVPERVEGNSGTDIAVTSLEDKSDKPIKSGSELDIQTTQLPAAPLILPRATYSKQTYADSSEQTMIGPERRCSSPVTSIPDEVCVHTALRLPEPASPPLDPLHTDESIYKLSLRCKPTVTRDSILRDCGMLITEHRPSRRSLLRKLGRLSIRDNSTPQHSKHHSPVMEMKEVSADYDADDTPLRDVNLLKSPRRKPDAPMVERQSWDRRTSDVNQMSSTRGNFQAYTKLILDTSADQHVESYKAASKPMRKSTPAHVDTSLISTQQKKLLQSSPVNQNSVGHHNLSQTTTKLLDLSTKTIGNHHPPQSTLDHMDSPRSTIGSHVTSQSSSNHQYPTKDATSSDNFVPPTVGYQLFPSTTAHHRRHISSQISVRTSHPSPDQTSGFDSRLKALEKQNELLSAALMAVLETNSTMQRSPPPAEKSPSTRTAQWESRIARRAAASGQAATVMKGSSGLGITMDTWYEGRNGGGGGEMEERN
nr:hypothetical protein CFP56_24386 [Quercus suber]